MQMFLKDKREYLVFLVFAVFIAIFYSGVLRSGFIYDDVLIVPQNPYIKSLNYLPKVITGCMWEHTYFDQCKGRALYYRPIHTLSYILTYQISSDPWVFHLVNLIYFFISVSLVYILAKILTGNLVFSFISAFVFLIHPVNSEVVNWIAAVPELTFAIFVLLSTIFYLQYRKQNQQGKFWLAAACYFFALLSKEPAVFLPAIFLFIDWKMFKMKIDDLLSWKEIRNYLVLAGLLGVYFGMRLMVLGSIIAEGPASVFSVKERIYALIYLFGQYIRKFFYPLPLVFFSHFDKRSDFLSAQFLLSFAVLLFFFIICFFAYKKKKNLLLFSMFWILFFLLPVLIFIGAAGESVFSERYDFVPSVGFAFLIGYLTALIWEKNKKLRILILLPLALVTGLSGYVVHNRILDWKDNETMYKKTLLQNPDATPIRFNYAVMLRNEKNDFENAKTQFEEIVKRRPDWPDISMVYLHLGDYYDWKGDDVRALEYYHKSADASEDWKTNFAYNRLGIFYARRQEYIAALTYFCQAVQANPESQESKANFEKALSIVDSDLKNKPDEIYKKITDGNIFKKSPDEKVRYTNKMCQDNKCSFAFLPNFGEYEIILPSLIVGSTSQNEAIKVENPAFDPKTGNAILNVDSKYENEPLRFIFPTCDRIYYEAVTK